MPRPESPRIAFAKNLRSLRTSRFGSSKQAAAACGINVKTYAEAEENNRATEDVTQKLEKVFGSLREPDRCSLGDVQAGFGVWEHQVGGTEPLELDALAIDLVDGEQFLYGAANGRASTTIRFRILVLAGPASKLACVTSATSETVAREVRRWSDDSVRNVELIRQWLNSKGLGPSNTLVTVEIREYDRIPELHGLRATKNGQKIYAWTRCYEDTASVPPHYDWGKDRYETETSGAGPPTSQGAREWDRLFESEWEKSKDRAVFRWGFD